MKNIVWITLTLFSFVLSLIAWILPIGDLVNIGPWYFTINENLEFAGRQFVLGNSDRWLIILIYITQTYFYFGSKFTKVSSLFLPLGLLFSASLVASISIHPILYAALLIEVAVLLGVPLLSPPGKKIEHAILVYITFLSLGLPFMIVGTGMLSGVELEELSLPNILPSLLVLGIGFAFILAVFPLNPWVPLILEKSNPYSSVFMLTIFSTSVIALLMRFTNQYPWIMESNLLQYFGILMVITGGAWALFQRNLGRILGYAILIDMGYALLAISQSGGSPYFVGLLIPRIIAYGVWGLGLSFVLDHGMDLNFRSVQGIGRQFPLIVLGILIANFSLAGIPLFASFPYLLWLWNRIAETSIFIAIVLLMGNVGLMASALRSLAVLVMGSEIVEPKARATTQILDLLFILGVFIMVVIGIFPNWPYLMIRQFLP
jgi:formate hydrogenlyase subunit 3/multisubunit Na+/H+ antiporter MnhD subunit